MTVRLTAQRPQAYNLAVLRSEADAAASGCRAVNEVAPDLIAAYWDDGAAPDVSVWAAVVASHTPPADPEPAPEPAIDDDRLIAAEQARRDAYDAVMAAGTLTMARINQANRAGMDAYLAALDAP